MAPRTLAELTVRDAMRRTVLALAPNTSIAVAAQLFSARHISGAPVVDQDGRPVGVFSLADLIAPDQTRPGKHGKPFYYLAADLEREPARQDNPLEGVVGDRMTELVLSVKPTVPLLQAIRLMLTDEVHRLLVLEDERLVGILTTMDALRAIAQLAEPRKENPP